VRGNWSNLGIINKWEQLKLFDAINTILCLLSHIDWIVNIVIDERMIRTQRQRQR
jgi:hypothetical protein